MTLRIFACPDCRGRRFASLIGVNVHLTRSHQVDYKLVLRKGKAYKIKKRIRVKSILVNLPHVREATNEFIF